MIELMPPAVETDLSAEFSALGFDTMTTETLMDHTFRALERGKVEIRPGQASLVAFMRRLAPEIIGKRFWEATRGLVPPIRTPSPR